MPNAIDLLVDVRPAPAHLDHPLPNGLQGPRAEVGGSRLGVEVLERTEGQAELLKLLHPPVCFGAVVLLRVGPEAGQHFLDGDAGRLGGRLPTGRQPLSDRLVVALLGSRVVQGVGAAFLTPIVMAMIGELVPKQHVGKAIGMQGVAYTVGVTLGPLISGLIEVRYGWPWFFYFMSALSLTGGVLYSISSKAVQREKEEQTGFLAFLPILKRTLIQPGILCVSFSAFSFFVGYVGIMTFTANHLKANLNLPSDQIGALLSITGFSGIIVSPIAGFLGDRVGRRNVFLGGAAIALACMAMMALVTYSYSLYLILFFLFGTGAATSWTSLNTMAVEISTEFRKPVTSVYNAIKYAGYAFSPVILSLIYAPFQLKAVQMGCIGAVIISSFLAYRAGAR